MRQWRRSRSEATLLDPVVVEAAPDSLNGLMAEMDTILATYDDRLDMEVVVVKIMAMVSASFLRTSTLESSLNFSNPAVSCLHVTRTLAAATACFPRRKTPSYGPCSAFSGLEI
jgi:hypothetical protein